jgi:hypothetical protein
MQMRPSIDNVNIVFVLLITFHAYRLTKTGRWTGLVIYLLNRITMRSEKGIELGRILTSYSLGCITFYIFLCFTGVVEAFLSNKGVDSLIIHTLIKHMTKGDARTLLFSTYSNFKYIIVNILVVFIFIYFLSKFLANRVAIYSLIFTIGAVTVDIYYFINMPFDFSHFFVGAYEIRFFNLAIWFICTISAIKMSYFLRVTRANKNVQPPSDRDRA